MGRHRREVRPRNVPEVRSRHVTAYVQRVLRALDQVDRVDIQQRLPEHGEVPTGGANRTPEYKPSRPARSGWLRTVRGWFSFEMPARQDEWNEVARTLSVPAEVLAQFRATREPALSDQEVELVVEALRQWVRIEGRRPGHILPSRAVHELQGLCELPDPAPRLMAAEFAMSFPRNPSETAVELQATFADAVRDERPGHLPLLFRVDEEVRWPGGLSYRGTCVTSRCNTLTGDGRVCVHFPWSHGPVGDAPGLGGGGW